MLLSSGRFALKHAVAGGVVVLLAALVAGLSWAALFLWALAAGAPLGGPLAFPFMVGGAILAATLSVVALLLPVTVAGEMIRRHLLRWSLFTEIPIATMLLAVVVLVLGLLLGPALGVPRSRAFSIAAIATGVLLLPLGAYWWSAQATDAVLGLTVRAGSRIGRAVRRDRAASPSRRCVRGGP